MASLSRYQEQLSTNRRITKLSDDPIGAISTLGVRTKIGRLEQHTRNVDDAKAWLTQSETAVFEVNEVLKSTYEQVVAAANDTLSSSDRNATLQYIEQLRAHLVQVGNSSFGNRYIFGGYNTTTPPFTVKDGKVLYNNTDLSTAPDAVVDALQTQHIEYEIGTGVHVKASLTGIDLFGHGENNLFYRMDQLIDTLKAGSTGETIGGFIPHFQSKQEDILVQGTEIGGRMKRLELVELRYQMDMFNFETVKSNVEDIDMADVIMKLKLTEASYNSALAIGNKIIQPSLVDFLR